MVFNRRKLLAWLGMAPVAVPAMAKELCETAVAELDTVSIYATPKTWDFGYLTASDFRPRGHVAFMEGAGGGGGLYGGGGGGGAQLPDVWTKVDNPNCATVALDPGSVSVIHEIDQSLFDPDMCPHKGLTCVLVSDGEGRFCCQSCGIGFRVSHDYPFRHNDWNGKYPWEK